MINSLGYSISARLAQHTMALIFFAAFGLICGATWIVAEWTTGLLGTIMFGAATLGMLSVAALFFRSLYFISGKPDADWSISKRLAVGTAAVLIAAWAIIVAILCGAGIASSDLFGTLA